MYRFQLLTFFLIISMGCNTTGNGKNATLREKNTGAMAANDVPAANGGPGIAITTTGSVPLYKQIHSGCVIDIFFGKGMTSRDILSDPYYSWLSALNLNSLQYSGGSTSDHDHVIIGDTLVKGGKGDGYNMRREDAQARGESFETLLDGVGNVKFGVDFFNQYCALLRKMHIRGDVIANVQGGTLQELYWKIQRANAQRVIFGMEQNISSNSYDFPDGTTYRKKISQWIDSVEKKFPGIITVIDAAPIYKQTSKFAGWNKQLEGIPGDEARLYLWDKDLIGGKENISVSLQQVDQVFSQTLPQWLGTFKNTFAGKKVAVCQWGIKAKNPMHNTMLGALYVGKFYEFMIRYNKANQNFIGYASFMPLKSLNRGDGGKGDADNLYKALKACGMLFSGNKQVDELAINGMSGLSGVACSDNGSYTLLLINETGSEMKVPEITVNGTKITSKNFTVYSVYATSPDSYDVKDAVSKEASVTLRPYSVNAVTF